MGNGRWKNYKVHCPLSIVQNIFYRKIKFIDGIFVLKNYIREIFKLVKPLIMLCKKHTLAFFLFSFFLLKPHAQTLPAIDTVYAKNIRTVQFADVLDGQGDVIIDLTGGQTLKLHFDDLDADVKNYS